MEYKLNDVIKKRLRQIDQTWTWLADQCGVARDTLSKKTMVFERMSFEEIFFISEKIDMNLMANYLEFLSTTRDEKMSYFKLEEPMEEYQVDDMSVWLCLKATQEIYKDNFIDLMQEIKEISIKQGFRIE